MEKGQKGRSTIFHKLIFWVPSGRMAGICAVLALLLLLIPLFRIAQYAVPWYDDLNYGSFTKAAIETAPGVIGALRGAAECVRVQWYAWQGTYSSIFFMALMPAVWGEEYYFLGPVLLLLLLITGVFVLMRTVLKDIFHADNDSCLTIQSVTAGMVLVLIYSSQAGIYWYNAGIHYVGMHSILMMLTAALLHLLYEKKGWKRVILLFLSMAGAVVAAGSNFVSSLQGIIILLSLMGLVCLCDRKKIWLYIPVLAVYGMGFYKNLGAPGNEVRSANYVGWGYPPAEAVLRSFPEALKYMVEFTGWITIAIMVLLIPVIWRMTEKSTFDFRLPGLVLAWSFCLYAAGFTPSLYSLGHGGLSRTLNAIKITYQILLIINEIYWLGWFRRALSDKEGKLSVLNPAIKRTGRIFGNGCPWWFYALTGIWMFFIFSQASNQAGCYSSYGAYYYVHTGEAYNFYQQYLERLEILKSDEKNVVFTPYRYKPWLICMGDLYEEPEREENRAVASWYDKDSVVVREDAGQGKQP